MNSIEHQLTEWVKGNPIHNKERNECCPDFSCCGTPIADKDVRERFAKAHYEKDRETIDNMLAMFLGNMLKDINVLNVHIAGDEPGKEQ